MKYIANLKEGMRVSDVYLCKSRQIQLTKNGKEYCSVILQDKTGTVDGKIWDLGNPGIADFDAKEYVQVDADVTVFNNANQLNIRRIRRADSGEYYPSDYLPVSSKNIDEMWAEFTEKIASVKNKDLNGLLRAFFEDKVFAEQFRFSSAAKTIHHNFVGGLLEHTLSVAKMCEYMCGVYPILNHDLLITSALLHDVGKTKEIIPFPENDYSDDGQLLGHIVMGVEMVDERLKKMEGYSGKLMSELKHCILAHHGEYEYGSPKKPAIIEAMALNLADNADAKLEYMRDTLEMAGEEKSWLGYNKIVESNIRRTDV